MFEALIKKSSELDNDNLNSEDKYYQLYLKFSKIKYPDAFSKFKTFYTPTKEIRKHGNNLVTWFMNKNNLVLYFFKNQIEIVIVCEFLRFLFL